MEKESFGFTSKIDPEVFQKFKAALAIKSQPVGLWLEQKIIEEAESINVEVK